MPKRMPARRLLAHPASDDSEEVTPVSRKGWLLFIAMCVIWGIPYLLIRVAVRELPPPALIFLRTAPAAPPARAAGAAPRRAAALAGTLALGGRLYAGRDRRPLAAAGARRGSHLELAGGARRGRCSLIAAVLVPRPGRRRALRARRLDRPLHRLRRRGGPRRHRHDRHRPAGRGGDAGRGDLLRHRPPHRQPAPGRPPQPGRRHRVAGADRRGLRSGGPAVHAGVDLGGDGGRRRCARVRVHACSLSSCSSH